MTKDIISSKTLLNGEKLTIRTEDKQMYGIYSNGFLVTMYSSVDACLSSKAWREGRNYRAIA
jgi:hypothetical protein